MQRAFDKPLQADLEEPILKTLLMLSQSMELKNIFAADIELFR